MNDRISGWEMDSEKNTLAHRMGEGRVRELIKTLPLRLRGATFRPEFCLLSSEF